MSKRNHNIKHEADVLRKSGRRCCLCFGLHRDFNIKQGQIAHIDKDPANTIFENLVFLCLQHHDQYDTKTSQSKGITSHEIIAYRNELYDVIEEFRNTNQPQKIVEGLQEYVKQQSRWIEQILNSIAQLTNELHEFRESQAQKIQDNFSFEEQQPDN